MSRLRRIAAMLALSLVVGLAFPSARATVPDGWPFLGFNEAVTLAKEQRRPMFVYFGFATCRYCIYLNQHTLSSESLRKLYSANYVLAYFDIRGNRDDVIMLPGGGTMSRGEAIRHLKGSPVPAWMFVDPDGRTVLMRRGSRTGPSEFRKYDLYMTSGAYRRLSYEEYLIERGLRDSGPD